MKITGILFFILLALNSAMAQKLTTESNDYPNTRVDETSTFKTECVIAVNPIDSLNLVAVYMDLEDPNYREPRVSFSTDGGLSWHGSLDTVLYADPSLAFDPNGFAYCTCLIAGDVGVLRSTDGGRAWTAFDQMLPQGVDEPMSAIDMNAASPFRNSFYIAAVQNGSPFPTGIVLQYRRPDSTSHSSTIDVSQQQLVQIPHVAIGPTGTIYISYIGITDLSTLSGGLYFNKSTDGGETFGADKLIRATSYTDSVNGFPKQGFPTASRIGPTPRIAIDTSNGPRRGWLYICYAAPTQSGFPPALNIFIQHSTDDGDTWSTPVRVNTDPLSSTNDHFTPSMALNPNGTIAVVYYDRRDDPNNLLVNAYVAISQDGGATFSDQRISTESTNPLVAHSRNTLSIADYIGIAVSRSTVFPIWTDGRQNTGDLDIYTSQVPIASSSSVQESAPQEQQALQYADGALSVSLDPGQYVQLMIRDVLGRDVECLFDGVMTATPAFFKVETSSLASGAYYAELIAGGRTSVVKFSYIR